MYKKFITVYEEDFLEPKAINASSITGTSVLNADGTMGALTATALKVPKPMHPGGTIENWR